MNRSDIEMAIVKHLLERAKEFGWVCTKVDNGDGYALVNDDDEVLNEAFAADSAELCFEREGFRQQWVLFVFGNDGYDVIADHTEPDPVRPRPLPGPAWPRRVLPDIPAGRLQRLCRRHREAG